ncbi:uncharacterized protein M6B38_205805 [Iris pallida]|uniref:Uncharacterized protein n=1 Tax=Iris pallida TaxID=29817 RepID=A0AAX6E6P4_IRIPA|nr:uncharacterized protein M6B38_205805 [Iris pallida]
MTVVLRAVVDGLLEMAGWSTENGRGQAWVGRRR